MPPPQFKPETQRALRAALLALQPALDEAEQLVTLRQQERERAVDRLNQSQAARDILKDQRRAIRQDLGDEP